MAPITPLVITHAFGGGGGGGGGAGGGGGGAGSGGGGGYFVGDPYVGAYGSSYGDRLGTRVFQIRRVHKGWVGRSGFSYGAFDQFHQRAPRPGWHVRRHASHQRNFHRPH